MGFAGLGGSNPHSARHFVYGTSTLLRATQVEQVLSMNV